MVNDLLARISDWLSDVTELTGEVWLNTVDNLQVNYSKTCVKRSLSKRQKLVFKTNYHLMRNFLQYFRLSLSYHLSLRSLFCLFLGGCFIQVLLYTVKTV